jgi:hypothetical protein
MSFPKHGAAMSSRLFRNASALLALGIILLCAQSEGQAQSPAAALPFSNSYLATGNYVVGSVDLPNAHSTGGFLDGAIHMSGVPDRAEILGAFLYWETIATNPAQLNGVKFRGHPIHMDDVRVVKKSSLTLTGNTASCFSSGGGSGATYSIYMMRADVRRLLPLEVDAKGNSTRKRLVNDSDLQNFTDKDGHVTPLPYHTVTLPEAGTGNQVPQSAGASLVVIYRDPTEPLRKILLYDGIVVLPDLEGAVLQQKFRGIFQSDQLNPLRRSNKLTLIAGSGQPNKTDRVSFNASPTPLATDPFPRTSPSSDRSWGAVTFNSAQLNPLMPGAPDATYGETVTVTVGHSKRSPYDCLSFAAAIFSTAEKDDEDDGIPDGLEQPGSSLKDANGLTLPNLYAMGARVGQKDIFIQMDAMRSNGTLAYGSDSAPFPYSPIATVPDVPGGHDHMPTAAATKIIIDSYLNAPLSSRVVPHLDVGNPAAYIAALPGYSAYFIQSGWKGGGRVPEQKCGGLPGHCQFEAFPGTVGWMSDFLSYSTKYNLFDPAREGLFHWAFYTHARGRPKSLLPCLDAGGNPTRYTNGSRRYDPASVCAERSWSRSVSGIASLISGRPN